MSDDKPRYMTADEVAEKLGLHPKTVYANEQLPRVKIGRSVYWIESQIDNYLLSTARPKAPRQSVMRQTRKLKEAKRQQRTGTESH